METMRESISQELGGYSLYNLLSLFLLKVIPEGYGPRARTRVYRILGWTVGPETTIMGKIELAPTGKSRSNITIGSRCFINRGIYIDAGATVNIGHGVAIGNHVKILTTSHELGDVQYRAGKVFTSPITVGNGAWIASGVTILPGITIGAGSIVAAGAVVTRDVPPNTLVGGVPAKLIRSLETNTKD